MTNLLVAISQFKWDNESKEIELEQSSPNHVLSLRAIHGGSDNPSAKRPDSVRQSDKRVNVLKG